jgi:hypothetical protein
VLLGFGWLVGARLRSSPSAAAPGPSTSPSAPSRRGVVGVYSPTTAAATTATTTGLPAVADPLGRALAVPAGPSPAAVAGSEPAVLAAPTIAPAPTTARPTTAGPTTTGRRAATTTTVPAIRRVTGVGDSIMLGAREPLAEALGAALGATIEVDARVGRPFGEGVEVVRDLVARGALGDAVVVHLGTNGPIDEPLVRALLDQLVSVRRVVVVNVRVPLQWEEPVNAALAVVAPTYPNVRTVDWYAVTQDRPELFWADGVHLRPEGSAFYAEVLVEALAAR